MGFYEVPIFWLSCVCFAVATRNLSIKYTHAIVEPQVTVQCATSSQSWIAKSHIFCWVAARSVIELFLVSLCSLSWTIFASRKLGSCPYFSCLWSNHVPIGQVRAVCRKTSGAVAELLAMWIRMGKSSSGQAVSLLCGRGSRQECQVTKAFSGIGGERW